ncbi:ATP-binding protein [Streptomyces xiaopingdaonensis]|uniref:ATP-binding protein n=1 Tax=Streptomyces xiaopingdaonensis TaxID=1565415 RepID=UPI00030CA532|nr:ATP-binding protein [Streptomyces xiaopingdaonensis]
METEPLPLSGAEAAKPPAGPYTNSFCVQLSSTGRGARLARLFAVQHLAEWDVPYGSALSDSSALVTAELAANAVRHCGGTGRDFRLRVRMAAAAYVRIEVVDTCADRPLPAGPLTPSHDLRFGHGLLLVDAVATRWGSTRNDSVTKTVWAELGPGPPTEDT